MIKELIRSLDIIQENLAVYVSGGDKQIALKDLRKDARRVTNTLFLIELKGAAMLSHEFERLLHAIYRDEVRSELEIAPVLVQAVERLSEYLTLIDSGSADIPLALLPLLNDLRAVRGASLLTEALMLIPDYEKVNVEVGQFSSSIEVSFVAAVRQAHGLFMKSLLRWLKGADVEASLSDIAGLLHELQGVSHGTGVMRLWRVAQAVTESLLDGGLDDSAAIKVLYGQLERLMQLLIKHKHKSIYISEPRALLKNFLYYTALSRSEAKLVQQIKSSFRLEGILPSEDIRNRALHALEGPTSEMLDAVGAEVRLELGQVKQGLEIYAHSDHPEAKVLEDVCLRLQQISATLSMLGMQAVADLSDELEKAIQSVAQQRENTSEEMEALAEKLLQVEQLLGECLYTREPLSYFSAMGATKTNGSDSIRGVGGRKQSDELLVSVLSESLEKGLVR